MQNSTMPEVQAPSLLDLDILGLQANLIAQQSIIQSLSVLVKEMADSHESAAISLLRIAENHAIAANLTPTVSVCVQCNQTGHSFCNKD